jgi:hypothetical protein
MRFSVSAICALLFASTTLATPATFEKPVSYDGHKVLRVELGASEAQAKKVEMLINKLGLDTWTHKIAPSRNVDVHVEPEKLDAFVKGLSGIPYSTMHEDLGASIREESESMTVGSLDGKYPYCMTVSGILTTHS